MSDRPTTHAATARPSPFAEFSLWLVWRAAFVLGALLGRVTRSGARDRLDGRRRPAHLKPGTHVTGLLVASVRRAQ